MTCAKCEALRAENARLQAEVQQALHHRFAILLREAFGLGLRSSALLTALYQAGGEVMTMDQLKDAIGGDGDNLVRVYIGRIRDALGPDSVPNVRGAGYRLSPMALARLETLAGLPQQVAA